MATDNRGGANGGPQYNPMNVNPLGGNGQSGTQAARYIPGMGYGQGKAMMQQQRGAAMQGSPMGGVQRGEYAQQLVPGPAVTPLTAPTQNPNEVITSGANIGGGPGMDSLNLPKEPTYNPDLDMVRSYLPAMEFWAAQPGTPQSTKDYVNYLRSIV